MNSQLVFLCIRVKMVIYLICDNSYQTHGDIHGRETRNADALYVPYGRLDIN